MTGTLDIMRKVLRQEAAGLAALADGLDGGWSDAVMALHAVRQAGGRIIVCGIGKSGHVGRKMAATLASTGAPAFFLHGTEASHGDLGMVLPSDALILLSASAGTHELTDVAMAARARGVMTLLITRNPNGALCQYATHVLLMPPTPEADPNGLAPTTSSTQTLAAGDALAMALMQLVGFGTSDFAKHHPGGKLGEQARSARAGDSG